MREIKIIMAKTKKEPVPKRSAPKHPKDYLLSIADKIHKTVPSLTILYNTLNEVWAHGADYGYQRRIEDEKYFRDKRDQRRKNSWDMAATNIDNLIHNKQKTA